MPSPSPVAVLMSAVPPELVPAIATPIAGLVAATKSGLTLESVNMIHLGWQFTALGCVAIVCATLRSIAISWIRTP